MKGRNYFLTFLFGLIGVLALMRSLERLFTGQGIMVGQLLFAAGGLALAVKFLRQARAAPGGTKPGSP